MKYQLPNNKILSTLSSAKGFTLVELLVVIAVLGVLAAGVLVAINPVEQLARGRDSAKKTAIAEVGRGLIAYQTTRNGALPAGAGWASTLQTAGDIKIVPNNSFPCTISGASSVNTGVEGGYCYEKTGTDTDFVVYAPVESKAEISKAAAGAATCPSGIAYVIFSSAENKVGLKCDTDVQPGEVGLLL